MYVHAYKHTYKVGVISMKYVKVELSWDAMVTYKGQVMNCYYGYEHAHCLLILIGTN